MKLTRWGLSFYGWTCFTHWTMHPTCLLEFKIRCIISFWTECYIPPTPFFTMNTQYRPSTTCVNVNRDWRPGWTTLNNTSFIDCVVHNTYLISVRQNIQSAPCILWRFTNTVIITVITNLPRIFLFHLWQYFDHMMMLWMANFLTRHLQFDRILTVCVFLSCINGHSKGMFRQRTKLDPNRFNFYEQQGVIVKIKPLCVQTALS